MIARISILLIILSANLAGQAVNEKIEVLISQAPLLRVNAGYDINLNEDGSAQIGETVYIYGGSPGFSYEWKDELDNYYYEKSPLVTNTGDYHLLLTDAKNCSARDTLTVFPFNTGVLPYKESALKNVRFDQAGSSLFMQVEGVQGQARLSIVNMKGALLLSHERVVKGASELIELNLSSFEAGMYLIYLQGEHNFAVSKFIIQ